MSIEKHYTNCLYIHGLHSKVNLAKTAVLEKYVERVTALNINYTAQLDAYEILKQVCLTDSIDLIVGSSFGGYLGFYLSRELQLPSILFNPAIFFGAEDKMFLKVKPNTPSPFSYFIMGEQDDTIPIATTREFIRKNKVGDNILTVSCNWLPHMIDLYTFEAMVESGIRMSLKSDL